MSKRSALLRKEGEFDHFFISFSFHYSQQYHYFHFNNPSLFYINYLKSQLLDEIAINQNEEWKRLVAVAVDNYGNPAKFWRQIKNLKGGD